MFINSPYVRIVLVSTIIMLSAQVALCQVLNTDKTSNLDSTKKFKVLFHWQFQPINKRKV